MRVNFRHMYMHVHVCAYSGGRLLLFMQEGVAFCWATSGARACAPNRDSHWGQQGPIGIHTGANITYYIIRHIIIYIVIYIYIYICIYIYINQNIPIGCNVKCLACIPFLAPAKTKVFCMFDTMPFTKLQLPSEVLVHLTWSFVFSQTSQCMHCYKEVRMFLLALVYNVYILAHMCA